MSELLRKNKNKLLASVAVIGLGVTAANLATENKEKHPTVLASVSVSVSEVVGGSDSDWEHGAAERAIQKGLGLAAERLDVNRIDFTEMIDELPIYDNAMKAVEMAHEDGVTPDKGDKLSVSIEVTEDSEKNISYEVTDATIIDISNNQE